MFAWRRAHAFARFSRAAAFTTVAAPDNIPRESRKTKPCVYILLRATREPIKQSEVNESKSAHYSMLQVRAVPPPVACTSSLQTWHRPKTKGIHAEPVQDLVVRRPKPSSRSVCKSTLYQATHRIPP
ncbi:hypothetical protein GJAV_G00234970 [Gymnothorax javanicus]|nr:hypothetical protein GJAV_G00234970 [Gymnothorax javanicus]